MVFMEKPSYEKGICQQEKEWVKVDFKYVSLLNMNHADGWLCQNHLTLCFHIMYQYTSQFNKENEIFKCQINDMDEFKKLISKNQEDFVTVEQETVKLCRFPRNHLRRGEEKWNIMEILSLNQKRSSFFL